MVGAWTGDQHSAVSPPRPGGRSRERRNRGPEKKTPLLTERLLRSIRGLMADCRVLTADANIRLRIPQLFGSGSAGLGDADLLPRYRGNREKNRNGFVASVGGFTLSPRRCLADETVNDRNEFSHTSYL